MDFEEVTLKIFKLVTDIQQKNGTLLEDETLQSQNYTNIRNRTKQVLSNVQLKIKFLAKLSDHISKEMLHELPLTCDQANLLYLVASELEDGVDPDKCCKAITTELTKIVFQCQYKKQVNDVQIQHTEENKLILILDRIKTIIDWRLKMTADKELVKSKALYQMASENAKMEGKIEELRELSTANQRTFDKQLQVKMEEIDKNSSEIERLKQTNKEYIDKEIFQSERAMMEVCKSNSSVLEELEIAVQEAESKAKNLLQENLEKQRNLRDLKTTAQLALKSKLNKYDTDVGQRTDVLNVLKQTYERETQTLKRLKEKFDKQDREYVRLMTEKETEEKQMQEERLLLFMMNRAARIIQRAWRLVLAKRKLKRGKKGKGKGKKKK